MRSFAFLTSFCSIIFAHLNSKSRLKGHPIEKLHAVCLSSSEVVGKN
jgi:hypothetical protein